MSKCADILILSWNRVDDTISAIKSALAQVGIDKSICVVDQGSDPENLRRLREYVSKIPEVQIEYLSENIGVAAGRNRAAAMGCAPYLIALDSDAEFADAYSVERAVSYLESRPMLCALGFRITNYFTGENDATSWDYPKGKNPERGFPSTRFIGAGHGIRRSTFEMVGGYDNILFFCGEEYDLCYRMLNTGARIEYFPTVEVLHKVSREHRVFWARGRYFYTVRNHIYSDYKFGVSLPRLLTGIVGYAVRGLVNGMPLIALRAALASAWLCRDFRSSSVDKSFYALTLETKKYISQHEPERSEAFLAKVKRQFRRLPHQA